MSASQRRGFDAFGLEPSAAFRERGVANAIDPNRLELAVVELPNMNRAASTSRSSVRCLGISRILRMPSQTALRQLIPRGMIQVEVPSAIGCCRAPFNLANRVRGLGSVTHLSP